MRAFLQSFSRQARAKTVRDRLAYCEERHAAHVKERHSRAFYDQYLRNYPDGASRAEVERLLAGGGDDRLWIEVQKTPTVALLKRYLADWPEGRHAAEANKLLPARERAEKTREAGRIAGGIGIGLGGLAVAGALLFTAASLLWALGQSAMSYDGSIIDWARKSLAELIAPAPKPKLDDPDWLKIYRDTQNSEQRPMSKDVLRDTPSQSLGPSGLNRLGTEGGFTPPSARLGDYVPLTSRPDSSAPAEVPANKAKD